MKRTVVPCSNGLENCELVLEGAHAPGAIEGGSPAKGGAAADPLLDAAVCIQRR